MTEVGMGDYPQNDMFTAANTNIEQSVMTFG